VAVSRVKVAVTNLEALIVTQQNPVPPQAPLQPVNVVPGVATAVSLTNVPEV
jgi:hypothetical protein